MGGSTWKEPTQFRALGGKKFVYAEHVRRDMQAVLDSLYYRCCPEYPGFNPELRCDEQAALQAIAKSYGLQWPEEM